MQPSALRKLALRKNIDVSTILRAINLAWSSTRCELEGHPVEYGIVLGSLNSVVSAVPQPYFRGPKLDLFKATYAKLHQNFGVLDDWSKSALIIDRHMARIEGIIELSALKVSDPYEYISGITNSICIVTKRAYSVRIYYDGGFRIQYIFNRKSGVIEARILDEFVPLLVERQIQPEVAIKVLDACLRVSETRKGALILLGPLTDLRMLSEASVKAMSAHIPETVATLPLSNMIRYMIKDGATWIDEGGLVRGHGLKFVGPGGRHSITEHVASRCKNTTAVVVSQDGEITIFFENTMTRLASQITDDGLFDEAVISGKP